MVSTNKRRDKDVMKLLVSEYDVNLVNDNNNSEFIVKFCGPQESPYEGVSKEIFQNQKFTNKCLAEKWHAFFMHFHYFYSELFKWRND